MSKPKIGLALGGGGAKGLAHIGVLRSLLKAGIQIDYIAGTSVGALIGGLFALHGRMDEIDQALADISTQKLLSLYSFGLPEKGLMGGEKIRRYFDELTGGADIQSCKIPFTAVATDLYSGEQVRLQRGPLAEAMHASSAIPLLFAPVTINGQVLLDGGLSEAVPVQTVSAMGANRTIAVNLDASYFLEPAPTSVRLKTITINSYNIVKHHLSALQVAEADVVIEPIVGDPSLLQFAKGDDLIRAGEDATKQQLTALDKLRRKRLFVR